MIKIRIVDEEKNLLKEYSRKSPLLLIRLKCQALLMRDKGMKLSDIGDVISKDEQTVGITWYSDYQVE